MIIGECLTRFFSGQKFVFKYVGMGEYELLEGKRIIYKTLTTAI